MKHQQPLATHGFTIIELMIALSVLSVILVMGTTIMIQIGNLYTKGTNAANLQNTTRNVASDIAAALQFSGNAPAACVEAATHCPAKKGGIGPDKGDPNTKTFSDGVEVSAACMNTTRYSYVMDRVGANDNSTDLASNTRRARHVLWRDTMTTDNQCKPLDLSEPVVSADDVSADAASGTPSKGYEMMPKHVRLTKFKIKEDPSPSGVYKIDVWTAFGESDLVNNDPSTGNATCQGGPGTQFCAISKISTTVSRRLK